MSREHIVKVWCDFPHDTAQEGREVILAEGKKQARALGVCDNCEAAYLAPVLAAMSGAPVADVATPVKPAVSVPAADHVTPTGRIPKASPGPCSECGQVAKSFQGWVQHVGKTHGWDQAKRDLWLAENAPGLTRSTH